MKTTAFTSPLYPICSSLSPHRHPPVQPLLPPKPPAASPPLRLSLSNRRRFDSVLRVSVEQEVGFVEFSPDPSEAERFDFDGSCSDADLKLPPSAALEVKELDELPEQWRRSKIAWLCKELPAQKSSTLVRILNAQRKWLQQEDITYVAVHCMRIRQHETGFKVYKWMLSQPKFGFDFALATKLADYMGKDRKYLKCREIFDGIIKQGRVPTESTFHILIIAYLSSSDQGCLQEACSIYNRMIQSGGYRPPLSLHNALFRALVSCPGGTAKLYLKQAEFIFHNVVTSGLEVHKDVYGGLIWLHSYQDAIDKDRIVGLRKEMKRAGFQEGNDVLLSVLRACSRDGDVEEAERVWAKLENSENGIPSQAFIYKMEAYAKVGDPMKSLEIFREMKKTPGSVNTVAYHKIIEILSKAQELELAESHMSEFKASGLKPLMPSYIDMLTMYFSLELHDKLDSTFTECLEKCRPNRTVYNIYLDSLLETGNISKAEETFDLMLATGTIGVNLRSCNGMLNAYISAEDYTKAEKLYDLMCEKKFVVEPELIDKLEYVLTLVKKAVKKPVSPKLTKDQREILVGLILGGLRIESDEEKKNHAILFEFNENKLTHLILKRYLYNQFHEWLLPSSRVSDMDDDIPQRFFTIAHSFFGFYADQFRPNGRPTIPKLIDRWLSPFVLAYWYMFGGHRSPAGDIMLKVKGDPDGVLKIIKVLKARSLECKVKRKGRVFWIGFLGNNSTWFWELVEPYVLEEVRSLLKPCQENNTSDSVAQNSSLNFSENASDDSDTD
uniref:Homing endonuclease LAGLIDADG domain-containing protein n=1 Tax=Kalanchoe fedtschenkoi TaxID=63787 RepID=A0A7N0TEI2_KALFE